MATEQRVEIDMYTIFETRALTLLRVRFLDETQFFLVTPWFTLKSGWL